MLALGAGLGIDLSLTRKARDVYYLPLGIISDNG
jgi:hypothetical protein